MTTVEIGSLSSAFPTAAFIDGPAMGWRAAQLCQRLFGDREAATIIFAADPASGMGGGTIVWHLQFADADDAVQFKLAWGGEA